ncbi:hypothetical protein TMO_2002 [Tistrella mobilis KA081020-065]|uniref:Uncharacterized protein n=1 Tax=Tistrella mobilis (strain KA081020-065) TaxID=1110502 RepID=I3TM52_TISMK|nr:hypothetical protein TMO_2002 [Tistrella mobilis KA081020-065]
MQVDQTGRHQQIAEIDRITADLPRGVDDAPLGEGQPARRDFAIGQQHAPAAQGERRGGGEKGGRRHDTVPRAGSGEGTRTIGRRRGERG